MCFTHWEQGGQNTAIAKFHMPCVKGIDFSRNIEIKGKSRTSEDAEEDAAFKALLFIEKKYNIKVEDLNHAERVNAKKEHKLLVRLLEQIVTESDGIKESSGKLVDAINTEKNAYNQDPNVVFAGEKASKKAEAYDFCAKEIKELATDSTKRYGDCQPRFEEMENVRSKMQEMKYELGLD